MIDPDTQEETPIDNLGWTGFDERDGDGVLGISNPVVKYENPFIPVGGEPDISGIGTFWFYSNIIPESVDADDNEEYMIYAKADGLTYSLVFTGDQPSCTIPEPTTLVLLGLGSVLTLRRRRA